MNTPGRPQGLNSIAPRDGAPVSRLQAEIERLFSTSAAGCTRALVLGLQAPADASRLAGLAQAAQADLGWPAPALAVDGRAGLQLWWSLAHPLPLAEAHERAQSLTERWLADVAPACRVAWPGPDGAQPPMPGASVADGRWSAFIAPDLLPVFSAEPWLDVPPSDAGQAELLAALRSLTPADLSQAQPTLAAGPAPATQAGPLGSPHGDPRAFLFAVMNDTSVPLALRIDAARALLAAAPR